MEYFIHYTFTDYKGNGDGNAIVSIKDGINNVESVKEIQNEIKKDNNFIRVVITNFIKVGC